MKYKGKTATITKGRYAYGDNLFMQLWVEGEPYATLTVNLPETLPYNEAYVDVNNFPEAEDFIKRNKIGTFTGRFGASGFCKYPLYKFDLDKIGGEI